MTFKDKLNQLSQTCLSIKNKLVKLKDNFTRQLAQKETALTQKTTQLQETNRKLELSAKERAEDEKVLDVLLKEMKELEESL